MFIVCRNGNNGCVSVYHSDKRFYYAYILTNGCEIKVYKRESYAKKIAKQYGGFVQKVS